MRGPSVWARVLGVQDAVIEGVEYDESEGVLVVAARPRAEHRKRCGSCLRRCSSYDAGEGRRRWRAMDLGTMRAYIEAEAPRVTCAEHGVVVAAVPWARHGARFTRDFEDQVAWLTTQASKSAVGELLRITWRTVGGIITRVIADGRRRGDGLDGLVRIGIDEVSHRKGYKYLTVVYDHDKKRVVWVAAGHETRVVDGFFDSLGPERCEKLQQVSADGAPWFLSVIKRRCPQAKVCLDPFHVVSWATDALDEVRRHTWNEARRAGRTAIADELKGARFALWKNPEHLTKKQEIKLATISKTNEKLYRAYLLKEQLRQVFKTGGEAGKSLFDAWLRWASRCRISAFEQLARRIRRHRPAIRSALELGLSNAPVESANTRIRLLIRRAFGFHSPEAVIALVYLSLGGLCPALPGR